MGRTLQLSRPLLLSAEGCRQATPSPAQKLLYFFRHGESTANVARRHALDADKERDDGLPTSIEVYRTDRLYVDAHLTPAGQAQAREAAAKVTSFVRPRLIVCSPLTRAIQTTALMFESDIAAGVPLCIRPDLREFFPRLTEDCGRTLPDLRRCASLRALPNWSAISEALSDESTAEWQRSWDDEQACGSGWRDHCADGERCTSFVQWLAAQPAERIATVSHWGMINNLLNRYSCIEATPGLARHPAPSSWGKAWPSQIASLDVENCSFVATLADVLDS